MKNTKWLWRILAVILTLVVLAGVGFAGFRVGLVQGADLSAEELATIFSHGRGTQFNGDSPKTGNSSGFDQGHGFDHGHGFDGRGFDRSGFPFFSPLFGLLRLAVLGGLIWLGYRFVKNSGWKLVKAETPPPAAEPPAESDEEGKESA